MSNDFARATYHTWVSCTDSGGATNISNAISFPVGFGVCSTGFSLVGFGSIHGNLVGTIFLQLLSIHTTVVGRPWAADTLKTVPWPLLGIGPEGGTYSFFYQTAVFRFHFSFFVFPFSVFGFPFRLFAVFRMR